MAFDGTSLLETTKNELRVTHDVDDVLIIQHINEAVERLNKFLSEPVESVDDLTLSQKRFVYIRVALTYLGQDDAMERAEGQVLELIRER
jgi:hypothetical protein